MYTVDEIKRINSTDAGIYVYIPSPLTTWTDIMNGESIADILLHTAIVSLQPLQFGLHMAILNAPMSSMSCSVSSDCIQNWSPVIPGSIYAVGGLLGSICTSYVLSTRGIVYTLNVFAFCFVAGSIVLASSKTQTQIIFARILTGFAAGGAVVSSPIYVNAIAPPHLKGLLGSSTQLNVNVGIIIAQILGVLFASENWRYIMYVSVLFSVIAVILLRVFVRSVPVKSFSDPEAQTLTGTSHATIHGSHQGAILSNNYSEHQAHHHRHVAITTPGSNATGESISIGVFLKEAKYRHSFITAVSLFMVQQLTGINTIILYGVRILSNSFPNQTKAVNLLLSIINLIATAISASIIDKFGSRKMLLLSLGLMGLFTALLALGLTSGRQLLTLASALLTIVSFAIGIGPIPFMFIGEVTPPEALSLAQSIGTVSSWLSTFAILTIFPFLDSHMGFKSFYIFSACSLASCIWYSKWLK